jgi:hypothetical protein
MGRQTFDRIKKTVSVLLAVLFVVSLTASACTACTDTATPTTATSDTSKTLSPSDLGTLLASLLNNMGYKLDSSNSGSSFSLPSNSESSFSFPSSLFNSVDTSGATV